MPLIQQYINKLNLISTKRKEILKKEKKARERKRDILQSSTVRKPNPRLRLVYRVFKWFPVKKRLPKLNGVLYVVVYFEVVCWSHRGQLWCSRGTVDGGGHIGARGGNDFIYHDSCGIELMEMEAQKWRWGCFFGGWVKERVR